MRQLFILFLFALLPSYSYGQLSGLYGDNAAAISVASVPKGTLELEPTYSYTTVGSEWNGSELAQLEATETSSSLNWRVTYGLGNDFEIGFGAPTDFSSMGFSLKKTLLKKEVFALGAAAGFTVPTLRTPQDAAKAPTAYGLGLLGYWDFGSSSFDINFQIQEFGSQRIEGTPTGYFFNADWGKWAIPDKLRFMTGIGLQAFDDQATTSSLWSIYPAIQYDFWNHFSLVLNSQHDFSGRNSSKSNVYSVTFTTIW